MKSNGSPLKSAQPECSAYPLAANRNCAALPLLSVVLPFFNQARYLRSAIESCLYASSSRAELILINDGSTDRDGIESALSGLIRPAASPLGVWSEPELLNGIPNWKIKYLQTENRGLAAAINTGFSAATGLFLTWSSGDNLYQPDALDLLAEELLQYPRTDLVYSDIRAIDPDGAPFRDSSYRPGDQDRSDSSIIRLPGYTRSLAYFPDNFINACFLLRRRTYLLTGNHRPELNGLEDYDYWLRIGSFGRIKRIARAEPIYSYRLHPDSMTAALDSAVLARKTAKRQQEAELLDRALQGDLQLKISSPAANDDAALRFLFCGSGLACQFTKTGGTGPASLQLFSSNNNNTIPLPIGTSAEFTAISDSGRFGLDRPRTDLPAAVHRIMFGTSDDPAPFSTIAVKSAERRFAGYAPLCPPEALKRSRDSRFGAVEPADGTAGVVLVVAPAADPPDVQAISKLSRIISFAEDFTFLLLAAESSSRQFADQVNINLRENSRLRIVDITDGLQGPNASILPLLNVLGSIDLQLFFHPQPRTLTDQDDSAVSDRTARRLLLQTVQAELALSALSGRRLVAVCDLPEVGQLDEPQDTAALFAALSVYEAPQMELLPAAAADQQILSALLRAQQRIVFNPGETRSDRAFEQPKELKAVDEWLGLSSRRGVSRQILALMCRK